MGKVKKKDYVFLTKWEGQDPKCDSKVCEEIELSLLPYQDLESCMKERRYERRKGALRQK